MCIRDRGITASEDCLFISAYCHAHKHNSVIWVLDKASGEFVKEIVLEGRPHVGSLAYDGDHGNLWICAQENGLAMSNCISADTIAVSYTHLDVYKRQAIHVWNC